MALAVSIHSLYALSGSLSADECCGRASFSGTRISTTSWSVNFLSGAGWNKGPAAKLKLQISSGGLRGRERHMQVGRFSRRRNIRAFALQERHSILSALTSTEDSSLTSSSSLDTNSVPVGEIELNYTTVKEVPIMFKGSYESIWSVVVLRAVGIVENLQDAPFLQYVYFAHQGGTPARQRLSDGFFEKPDTWGPVRKCLLDAAPDGIIMVHRLDRNNPSECCLIEKSSEKIGVDIARGEPDGSGSLEDYWGLLVHGCNVRCNACYLLRTTRQPTPNGFTTYFMLIRAECFGPSVEKQFQRASLGLEGLPAGRGVACGGYHTGVVTRLGDLYVWGSTENGCLGFGYKPTDHARVPMNVDGALRMQNVVEVSCGWKHTCAVTDGGKVFAWGWGGSARTYAVDGRSGGGQLGLGDEFDYNEPTILPTHRMMGIQYRVESITQLSS